VDDAVRAYVVGLTFGGQGTRMNTWSRGALAGQPLHSDRSTPAAITRAPIATDQYQLELAAGAAILTSTA
jgi:hypothetical protein